MLTSISEGTFEIGHIDWEDSSFVVSSTGMGREENEAMSSDTVDTGGPSREWWAGFGIVIGAFDGLGLVGFDLEDEGGKCLFL